MRVSQGRHTSGVGHVYRWTMRKVRSQERGWTHGGRCCEMQVKGGCRDENRLEWSLS